jgi:hypothetical protein
MACAGATNTEHERAKTPDECKAPAKDVAGNSRVVMGNISYML